MNVQQNDGQLYTIAQVNAITGVAKPTIRFWGKEFREFLNPQRTNSNHRRYTRANVDVIERINHLTQQEGYTLEGARKRMREDVASTADTTPILEYDLEKIADTMSDYLLKRIIAKTTA